MKRSGSKTVMERANKLFATSGKTLEEVGKAMGYDEGTARRAAWQFLNKTADPRLSMLFRFAEALGVEVTELFA
jgi:transcriptional regulator with XRE-family HTH domain